VNINYPKGPLREGEPVVLLDRKDREYLARLDPDRPLAIRGGKVCVQELIGRDEGCTVRSSVNEPFLVFRPSLPQLIPNLPRNAQVIYPKDLGPILIWADLFPGARVVEAGVGAGALSMTLLRAIGSSGQLITYEIREDFAEMARKTVSKYFGPTPNWILKVGDIESELEETDVDRVVLDLPEPWKVIERAWKALKPGGILLSYLPTVIQVKNLVDGLRVDKRFACIETMDAVLAHKRPERPAATPHDRPHGFFDCRAPLSKW
jgi:tRNA (adenine57-N1/adenine58-N1)-methyltransferase